MKLFNMRNLFAPFTYMYERLREIVHRRRGRSETVSPILDSESDSLFIHNNDRIYPPFPLRIRIPPDFSPKKHYRYIP